MFVIGVDIGGTKCAVTLGKVELGAGMQILDKCRFATGMESTSDSVIRQLMDAAGELLYGNHLDICDIVCVGISCGGPLDSKAGVILSPPNLIGWNQVPIVDIFQEKLGIHAKLQNDANAGALAEWMYGAGRGYRNMVYLTFGTGFGAGLILDGKLYSGTNDMAGEIGHVRISSHGPVGYGKAGSLEGFCSGGGIAQLARTKILERFQRGETVSFCPSLEHLDAISAKIVGDAADKGDQLALDIYRTSGQYLGRGLSILIDILNPEIIVIGSIFARSTHLLWPYAKEVIESEALALSRGVCRVVPSALGEQVGDLAALSIAAYEMGGES